MPIQFTPVQHQFLECISAYLDNREPLELISREEQAELIRLAMEQKLIPMLYASGYCRTMEDSLASEVMSAAKNQSLAQTIATISFSLLYREFQSEGLEPILVKGMLSRSLYRDEAVRPSGDEDIYAGERDFLRCHNKLMELGAVSGGGDVDGADVIGYTMPNALHIELHRRLFDESSEYSRRHNRFFEQAQTQRILLGGRGAEVEIRTFAHTENLYYMLLHALKHFIGGGFGVRTALDIALYAQRYLEKIDGEMLQNLLIEDCALNFTSAVFDICIAHFGVSEAILSLVGGRRAGGDDMLYDMLSAGVYGTADESRAHSANITKNSANGGGSLSGLMRSLFPPISYMRSSYDYLNRCSLLLPAAWIQRGFKYLLHLNKNRGNSASDALRIGEQRSRLLRKYDIRTDR